MKRGLSFSILAGLILFYVNLSFSATINVPDDHSTIQAGIIAASNGDTVLVAPGVYIENIDFAGKNIVVTSSDGAEFTTLQSDVSDDPTVMFGSGESSSARLSGFTILGSINSFVIIVQSGSTPTISHNIFTGSTGEVTIACAYSNPTIAYNLFYGNGGISCIGIYTGSANIINNTFDSNARGFFTHGSGIAKNNIISNSTDYGIAEGDGSFSELDYNDVWNNDPNYYGLEPGANDFSADPLYVNPDSALYYLSDNSPCVNAGDPNHEYNDPDGTRNDVGSFPLNGVITPPAAISINLGSEYRRNVITHTPTINWSFYDTTTGSQAAYELEVGTDDNWAVAEMWTTGEFYSSDTFCVYAGGELFDGEIYYLRIRLYNGSTWGEWRFYAFRMSSIPEAPNLNYPISDMEVNINGFILIVDNSYDHEYDNKTYDFEIYDDLSLNNLVAHEYDIAEQQDSTVTGYFTGLSVGETYYWRARSFDAYEYSEWSLTESFIIRPPAAINIPGEYAKIQAGINVAGDGDMVLVAPGTYTEDIDFDGKAITVLSLGGRDSTVIMAASDGGNVVTFNNSEDTTSVLDGFTINGLSKSRGIYCDSASPIIQNCDVSFGYTIRDGGGIYCDNSAAKIRYNRIHDNDGGKMKFGGGICAKGSEGVEILYNEIYRNTGAGGPGIGCPGAVNVKIAYNLIYGNFGDNPLSGGIYINGYDCEILNNTIFANSLGITILDGSGISILNNIIISNRFEGIVPATASFDYNDIWNNGSANNPGVHGILLDPLLTDTSSHDFTLQLTSPCIDAGNPDPEYNDPDGSRNDMGALPLGGLPMGNLPIPMAINLGNESRLHVISHTPTIYWTFYDTTRSQAAYEIEIGTDGDWTVAEMWATGEVYSSDTFCLYAGGELIDGTIYYCRIRLKNETNWGDWREIIFRMNTVPTSPVPLYPISQEEVQAGGVQLIVDNSDDAEVDQLTYDYEIYDDPALSNLVAGRYGIGEQSDSTSSGYILGLYGDREYFWRARASDGYEYSTWTPTESFMTLAGAYINIPGDYSSIQAGIDAAGDGDIVLVGPGTYTEFLNFNGKRIVVKSSDGPLQTIITNGNDSALVTFNSGEDTTSVIEGFTLLGGWMGVYCINSGPTIRGNLLRDQNTNWSAISLAGPGYPSPTIGHAPAVIINNTIVGSAHGGISSFSADCPVIKNNIVAYNASYGINKAHDSLPMVLSYNNVYGNVYNNMEWNYHYFNDDPGIGSFSIDAIFEDDYSLGQSSPCIDAGDPNPIYNDADGSRADIGAIPYTDWIYPVTGAVRIGPDAGEVYIPTTTPEISWSYLDTADTKQEQFEIEVGTDNDWSVAEMWATGPVPSDDTSIVYAGTPLSGHHSYYLRIRLRSETVWGDWKTDYFIVHSDYLIKVPDDLPTMQAGIDSAYTGDTIIVADGVYSGDGNWKLDFRNKPITLKSENGPDNCIIDLSTAPHNNPGLWVTQWEDTATVIDGFKIINGFSRLGGAVYCTSSPTIKNCIFENNLGGDAGGAICVWFGGPLILNCQFINNGCYADFISGGALAIEYGGHQGNTYARMVGCSFINNISATYYDDFKGALEISTWHCAEVENCTFVNNYPGAIFVVSYFEDKKDDIKNYDEAFPPILLVRSVEDKPKVIKPIFMSNNIIAFNNGHSIRKSSHNDGPELILNCCNIFGNTEGDWVDVIEGMDGYYGNISLDPTFCDTAFNNYKLAAISPCLPSNNSCGLLIGAFDEGCPGPYLCGDVNDDSLVNIFDITYLISFLYIDGPEPVQPESADVNGDSDINIFDVTYLIFYLYMEGPEPDCP